ncbi:polysaccharide biosynthesis tyrosine autokinase [Pokkaliibacter sp. CJK22405]|uniref:polysaccharide biosynthesis tyrosine autokinase n=1 Tax=Pokkaliibacter sp. CJK22405 TaxID=3384615 RepID=UPI003984EE77
MNAAKTPPVVHHSNDANDDIALGQLFGIILEGKWIIVCCLVIAGILGVGIALLSTPIYQASSLVQVEPKQSGIAAINIPGLTDQAAADSAASTETEIIQSRFVLGKVIDNLKLRNVVTPDYFPVIGSYIARRYNSQLHEAGELNSPFMGLSSYAWGGEQLVLTSLEVPDYKLNSPMIVEVGAANNYTLYDANENLILKGQVGESAKDSSGEYLVNIKTLTAHPGTRFFISKVTPLSAYKNLLSNLTVEEKTKSSGILTLQLTGTDQEITQKTLDNINQVYYQQNVQRTSAEAEKSLEFLDSKLPEVKGDLEQAEKRLNDYRLDVHSVNIDLETKSILDQVVTLESQINELNLKEADLQQKYTPKFPAYAALIEQRAKLKAEKKTLNDKIKALPETQQEVLRYTRDVQVGNQLYLQMLSRTQELDIAKASTVGNVRVLDSAIVDPAPVKPRKPLIVAIAVVLGFILGAAIVFVRAALRKGIESPEQIEQELGLSVYATIPYSEEQDIIDKDFKKGKRKSGMLAIENPAALSIESLRALRTSLHFAMMESKNNVISISGPSPDIGKSFVSSNLGAVLAAAGSKILVIDADMRKGHLQKFFGVPRENGLSDYLCGDQPWQSVVHHSLQDGLDFISTGTIPPNPSELLMSQRLEALFTEAGEKYDLILIDTPPIMAVTDAAIIGRLAGVSLMVVRFGLNPLREIAAAHRRFEQNGIPVKGCIMNGMKRSGRNAGYGYGYGYYNYEYKSHTK